MVGKVISSIGILAAVVLLFFVSVTTPSTAGPLGILIVFLSIYIITVAALTFALWFLNQFIIRFLSPFSAKRPISQLSIGKAYYFSSVIALGPVMVLGIQSVGTVGVYELSLIILLVVLGCFYIAKRTV